MELPYTIQAKPFTPSRPNTKVIVCNSLLETEINLGDSPLLIVDKNLLSESNTDALLSQVREKDGFVLEIEASEDIKEYSFFESTKEQIGGRDFSTLVIIGGGTTINLSLYLAKELGIENNESPTIIPTNTMSFADVAIGSLGLLNKDGVKNNLQIVCDPAAVVVIKELYDTAPALSKTDGMIEVVKHALFQDPSILEPSTQAFLGKGSESEFFELAARVMSLKIDLQNAIIEGNESLDQLLTYGHLHAHVLEEYFNYTIPHSYAVYIGLLIDLKLAGPNEPYKYLLESLEESQLKVEIAKMLSEIDISRLEELYLHMGKYMNEETKELLLVELPELGFYKNLDRDVILKGFSFDKISNEYAVLKERIS